jgi:hypothetical protein
MHATTCLSCEVRGESTPVGFAVSKSGRGMAVSNPPRPEDAVALDEPIEAILVDTDDDEPQPKPAPPTSVAASRWS